MTKLMTAEELADYLSVTPRAVYKWAASGVLPAVRIGRTVRFHPDAVQAALGGQNGGTRDSQRSTGSRQSTRASRLSAAVAARLSA